MRGRGVSAIRWQAGLRLLSKGRQSGQNGLPALPGEQVRLHFSSLEKFACLSAWLQDCCLFGSLLKVHGAGKPTASHLPGSRLVLPYDIEST